MSNTNTATKPAAAAGPATASTAMQKAPTEADILKAVQGSWRDPNVISNRLQAAAARFHLVSPATAVGRVPEGTEVVMCAVWIDIDHETYAIKGSNDLGIARAALDKIAAAAGISWDPRESRRLDDASHPHYCHWRAVGRLKHLDGTTITLVGNKEMDLRTGSEQAAAAGKGLDGMRQFILAHAETKARLRAVRSMGIRAKYSPEELRKPFLVARLMWTGASDDPELRRLFAMKQADAMLGGHQALYGEPMRSAPEMLPAPAPPPPLGAPRAPDSSERMPPAATTNAAPATPAPAAAGARPAGDLFMPGKKGAPKVTVSQASDDDLVFWSGRIEKNLADGSSQYAEKDRALLDAMKAEQARRAGPPAGDTSPATDPARDDAAAEEYFAGQEGDRGDDPNRY